MLLICIWSHIFCNILTWSRKVTTMIDIQVSLTDSFLFSFRSFRTPLILPFSTVPPRKNASAWMHRTDCPHCLLRSLSSPVKQSAAIQITVTYRTWSTCPQQLKAQPLKAGQLKAQPLKARQVKAQPLKARQLKAQPLKAGQLKAFIAINALRKIQYTIGTNFWNTLYGKRAKKSYALRNLNFNEESPQMGRPRMDKLFRLLLIILISFIVHISPFIDYIQFY